MYQEMFEHVRNYLDINRKEITKVNPFPFRKRSDHIQRVFNWAKHLLEGTNTINQEAVLVAALFHDVGYALDHSNHALYSAIICEKYLSEHKFDPEFIELVVYLVKNHSNKHLMTHTNTPLELITLMEADLLDETGALSIVWDCMNEGNQKEQTFEKTFNHIMDYSYQSIIQNPMVTPIAKAIWESKQKLTKEFVTQLSFDLGIHAPKIKRP